eukprot:CAMPEP_0182926408 /NCGR_PEP_ID=MMETSP0105_2-20130417/12012_1 /TAXON_ID=81532 ORGANISM="Acanthoeca-like sp., Strain 10tr" /NCGR_SAMPLE_ID=MMETSP0105_2 /ASSEMBLY_ACC=CAM_ASM_000205 /LENGTH=203 /DNA_ID=CAMNT_0025064303 /DNA_START=64 /DNA_END=676 /DNA_ORIENTATION=+
MALDIQYHVVLRMRGVRRKTTDEHKPAPTLQQLEDSARMWGCAPHVVIVVERGIQHCHHATSDGVVLERVKVIELDEASATLRNTAEHSTSGLASPEVDQPAVMGPVPAGSYPNGSNSADGRMNAANLATTADAEIESASKEQAGPAGRYPPNGLQTWIAIRPASVEQADGDIAVNGSPQLSGILRVAVSIALAPRESMLCYP